MGEDEHHLLYIVGAPKGTLIVAITVDPDGWDTLGPYWQEVVDSIEFAS